MTWEIYTTGGGYFLSDVFNMLAAYTDTGNFRALISIGVVIGIAWTCIQLAFGAQLRDSLKYFMTMTVVMMFTLGPKTTVAIIDKTAGTIPIYGVVDNVPLPVAMLGHYTSGVSYYLTGQMEALLSTPTDLAYQKNGMLFGATLLSQAADWRAVSPKIHENLVNFMQNCIIDGTNLGHIDLELVASTGNLESFITSNLPASMAYYDVMTSETRACQAGWPDVRNAMTAEVDKVLAAKAAGAFQGSSAAGPENINRLKATLGEFQSMMAMSAASAVQTIKQAMYVNSLDDGLMRFIANSGNSAAMDVYQVARSDIQTRSSYAAIGANATKWVPLLKIVFETLYYAAFPMAVMMMMTPLAPAVLKGYAGGFVWLAAWEPLSAILHSVVIKASTGFYRSAGAVSSDGTVNDVVLSWANHFGIRAVEQDVGTAAGFMMMSVPFLASAIMFGATRMTGMATSMLNVSQGAAIETGREAATGSISLGNMSMNNYAGNKMNMSSVLDNGRMSATMGNGGVATINPDGSIGHSGGSAISTGALSSQIGSQVRTEIATRAEQSRVAAESAATELGDYISRGASELTSFGKSVMSGQSTSEAEGWDASSQHKTHVSDAMRKIEDFAQEQGISTEMAMRAGISANLGVASAGFVKAGVGVEGGAHLSGVSREGFSKAVKAASETGIGAEVAKVNSARASGTISDTTGTQSNAGEERRFNLDEGERLAQTYISRLDESQSYARAQSRVESEGASLDYSVNQMVASELHQRGYSPLDTNRIFNPKTDAEFAESREVVGGITDKIVDQVVSGAPTDATQGYKEASNRDDFRQPLPREAAIGNEVVSIAGMTDRATSERHEQKEMFNDEGYGLTTAREAKEAAVRGSVEATRSSNTAGADRTVPGAMWNRIKGMLNVEDGEAEALARAHPDAWGSPGRALDYYSENSDKFREVTGRPFVDGGELGSSPENRRAAMHPTPMRPQQMTLQDRDTMIRTVLSEAASEGNVGMAAVALVIRNRAEDSRYPDSVGDVSLQPRQFSAWNGDGSGNHLVTKYGPGDAAYEQAAYVVDAVMGGYVPDFTQGATHYYAPVAMSALVESGYQRNLIPGWLANETASRDAPPVRIGGHLFTGQVRSDS